MKSIFWIGLAVLIMGIASLLIPIPRSEKEGFRAGRVSVGIETHHEEKVSPIVSAVMILVGAGMMIAQRVKA
jgi:prolipoprotein diacylglyceryltransferase